MMHLSCVIYNMSTWSVPVFCFHLTSMCRPIIYYLTPSLQLFALSCSSLVFIWFNLYFWIWHFEHQLLPTNKRKAPFIRIVYVLHVIMRKIYINNKLHFIKCLYIEKSHWRYNNKNGWLNIPTVSFLSWANLFVSCSLRQDCCRTSPVHRISTGSSITWLHAEMPPTSFDNTPRYNATVLILLQKISNDINVNKSEEKYNSVYTGTFDIYLIWKIDLLNDNV